ncbi:MAG: 16S rRNA (cytosine(1402)-N(4))-methyltransferase RsmH [Elusimicrobia bacterium]|nr:16S rRNA (cytosine(1402)-N(4))-methyltransferase RsmH [Elusimicrobiota bacterium]
MKADKATKEESSFTEQVYPHVPVMVREVLHFWVTKPSGFYVDLTLGMGGHTEMLLTRYPQARCLGVDWDLKSFEIAKKRLAAWGDRVLLRHANFTEIGKILRELGQEKADGILFDLGPSTFQILQAGYGLSYQKEAPLDMRFGLEAQKPHTAAELLKVLSSSELEELLVTYGELPKGLARSLGRAIHAAGPKIQTTTDLIGVLSKITTHRGVWARVFQSLRILVNGEINNLEKLLAEIPGILNQGGRAVAISFHSLEDRAVKRIFRQYQSEKIFKVLTSSSMAATSAEIASNPKARSARLRAAEKI